MGIFNVVFLLLLGCLVPMSEVLAADPPEGTPPTLTDIHFAQTAPYSTAAELKRRLGYLELPPDYDIGREQFQMLEPDGAASQTNWGLLVWISAGEDARIPGAWKQELAKHRLIFVGACRAGNNRSPFDRFRLALDAAYNMSSQFKIDPQRIYVGGFSGGARIASILGVAYADVFHGTLCVCGVNFYKNVPAPEGKYYTGSYVPDPNVIVLAKKGSRIVLITGEEDMNRQPMRSTWEGGFKANGFQNVLFLDVKGMKHAMPGAPVLNTSLNYLTAPSH